MHIHRWDLDKTYLDTDIHSVSGLLRAAVEPATHKRTLPGAAALLRALCRCDKNARVCVLSGSPEQMRSVLEEKLQLDGVRFDQLLLKDNLGNIRKGRLRAVRGQVGYKLPRLLELRVGLGSATRETLFGDDSEADAAVYALYADALAGRTDGASVERVLQAAGAYPGAIRRARAALERLEHFDAVEQIFIRMLPRVPPATFELLGPQIIPVFSWFQAALLLRLKDRIDDKGVAAVALACSRVPGDWAGWLTDMVRRGYLQSPAALVMARQIMGLAPAAEEIERRLSRMGPIACRRRHGPADYVGFLRAVRAR